ncbi:MAG: phosphoribosylanthranilate isomerase [Eubacteriales bacterium]|nr:phosphoribosylanthranilate isomerase [Eubacteriales bacterium]MDO5540328.1 phosphoribosylanthranilate isomerase [Eubacteriales bacterium]
MNPLVKICGLRRPADILYVNEAMPDFIGYVFAGSRRRVSREEAAELTELLDEGIVPVGVFVNEEMKVIQELAWDGTIRMIQLHGQEPPEYARTLHRLTGLPIIKAISVTDAASILRYQDYPSDYLLLDKGAGGTGKRFSWEVLEQAKALGFSRKIFLAGGLCPENVREAAEMAPWCLDVSSGVETDGFKDREKIRRFMKECGRS